MMNKCDLYSRWLLPSVLIMATLGSGVFAGAATPEQDEQVVVVGQDSQKLTEKELLDGAAIKLYCNQTSQPLTEAEGDAVIGLVEKTPMSLAEKRSLVSSVTRAVRSDLPSAQPVSCCPQTRDANLQKVLSIIVRYLGSSADTIYGFEPAEAYDVNTTTTLTVFQWLKLIYDKCK